MERVIIYRPGDIVRFVPTHADYSDGDLKFAGLVGRVLDSSDLPNVYMETAPTRLSLSEIICADQRDLEAL